MAIYLYTALGGLEARYNPEGINKTKSWFFDDPMAHPGRPKGEWAQVHEITDVYFGTRAHPQVKESTGVELHKAEAVRDWLLEHYFPQGLIQIANPVPTPDEMERARRQLEEGYRMTLLSLDIENSERRRSQLGDARPTRFQLKALAWRESLNRAPTDQQRMIELLAQQVENQRRQLELQTQLTEQAKPVVIDEKPPMGPPIAPEADIVPITTTAPVTRKEGKKLFSEKV